MTEKSRSAVQGSFTLERTYPASRQRVYDAFATEAGKARWFGGPPDAWDLMEKAFDFRVGGKERLKAQWKTGRISDFQATYHDIVPLERIVYVYDMYIGDDMISVSLATIEFQADGDGTKVVVNEQGTFLDGYDDAGSREHGTGFLLDYLGASLAD